MTTKSRRKKMHDIIKKEFARTVNQNGLMAEEVIPTGSYWQSRG